MNKRLLVQLVSAFVLGILTCIYETPYLSAGMLLLFLGANICRWKQRKIQTAARLILWVFCYWFGLHTAEGEQEYRRNYEEILISEPELLLQGDIARKEVKQEQYLIYLKNVILQVDNNHYHTNQILIYLNTNEYCIGKTLVLKGKIENFREAVNDGNFDEKRYYETLQTDCRVAPTEIIGCYGSGNLIAEYTYQLRSKLKQNITNNMDEKYAGIVCAMILGDKSLLPREIQEQYQKAGISHILVISGLHISMIGMGVFRLLRRCRMGMFSASVVSVVLLFWYGSMIGMGASTARALWMYLIGAVAGCTGRTYDRPTALALTVFLLLYQNPFLVGYSGFQFSVAAIIGVILAGRMAKSWKVSGMIQLMTMPIAAYSYFELSLWSLLANLLVIPLMGIVVSLGLFGSLAGIWFEQASRLIFYPIQWVLAFYEKVSFYYLKLPFAQWVVGQPAVLRIFLYYLLLWLLLCLCTRLKKMEHPGIIICTVFGIGLAGVLMVLTFRFPQQQLDVLDVGQGDAICIQAGNGLTFFIDGGSSDISSVGKYRIEPYLKSNGISQIDYWFISHADTDHISGLMELLERNYSIKHLVLAKQAVRNEHWETIVRLADERKIPICYMAEGDCIQAGEHRFRCIFPNEGMVPADINAGSMVLLYEAGAFRGILTGDITSAEEAQLLTTCNAAVTYYKAAHHGSKYSNSKAWLELLSPQITTISCSLKNSYGHPGKEVVEHLQEVGSDIYMTMEDGQISLNMEGEYLTISKYRKPLEVIRYPMIE